MDDSVIENLPPSMSAGVYAGWAQVNDGDVYKMVMSLGWNPFYKNERKSLVCYFSYAFDPAIPRLAISQTLIILCVFGTYSLRFP